MQNRAISLFGLLVIIVVMWATSQNRKVSNTLYTRELLLIGAPDGQLAYCHRWDACPVYNSPFRSSINRWM